jgi:hypothetical protein
VSLPYFLGWAFGRWKLSPWIVFFTWMVALSKILTIDNFRRQGLTLVNWCCICTKSEEIVNHFFIHCEFTSKIWHLILILFETSWVMPSNIVELLQCWKTQGWRHSKEAIWKVIPILLMWSIWRKTNQRLFEDREYNVLQLKSSFLEYPLRLDCNICF